VGREPLTTACRHRTSRTRHTLTALALLVPLLVPADARADNLRLHGLLDLTLSSSNQSLAINRLTMGDSNVDPYRVRLFVDARINPTLEVHVQTVFHEGMSALRADGAYALWTPWQGRDLSLEGGKIPSLVGVYAPRAYSDQNWVFGTPLLYYYHTALPWNEVMADVDEQISHAGLGQVDPDPAFAYMPMVDERWWDTGVAVLGSWRPLAFTFGVTQGSPAWPAPGYDDTPGLSVAGRLGWVPTAGVRVGVSGSDGTWMPEWFEFDLPAGRSLADYRERTWMADAEFARGPFEVRGEWADKRWDTFHTGTLRAWSGYAEGRWAVGGGAWLAFRGDVMRFSDVTTSANVTRPWDDPVDRYEATFGYRFTREVRLKLGGQRTAWQRFAADREHEDVWLASLGVRF
jgi:hypothetical protein